MSEYASFEADSKNLRYRMVVSLCKGQGSVLEMDLLILDSSGEA